jgi:type IV pilus assembly protein PilB
VCGNSGYRGRVGIFEIFEVTDAIKEVITSTTFSLEVLIEEAKKQGMVTMFEDGIRKIKLGVTTVEEVLRVIRE